MQTTGSDLFNIISQIIYILYHQKVTGSDVFCPEKLIVRERHFISVDGAAGKHANNTILFISVS